MDLKRTVAKRTNFLTSYGGGGYGLQTTLAEEAVYLRWKNANESLRRSSTPIRRCVSISGLQTIHLDTGVAVSLSGRIRVFGTSTPVIINL